MSADALWFRRFRPSPEARSRLICFPHAGSSASAYLPLVERLAPRVDVLVVQYPGRMDRGREPLPGSLTGLAGILAGLVSAGTDPRPLALYGYSMGATVAYEVARRLERTAAAPARLFVSARTAPSIPFAQGSLPHRGSDEALVEHLAQLQGTPLGLLDHPGVRALVLPVIRGDYTLLEEYRWQPDVPPLACPVSVWVGDADPLTPVADARAWAGHTTGGSELAVLPGGHFLLEEHLDRIAAALLARLDADHRGTRPGDPVRTG
ncbi:thioesterase [Streptacidiphilus sp. 4-A2]|nr:thioesterase [Streptacidiphilus sp. 4-A2]